MIFAKKQNFGIGLDISDRGIRAAQAGLARDKAKLQALGFAPLEEGLIRDEEIQRPEAIVKKITELLSAPEYGSFSGNEVVAKLPGSMSYIKYIQLEATPNNLPDMVAGEIEKHIPLAKKDMYYDYQLIKSQNQLDYLLIGAAPKPVVDQYLEIMKAARLEVSALEINSACDCRALIPEKKAPEEESKVYALIDVGAINSFLTIYTGGTIVLSISMPISGQEASDQIAETLKIGPEQAEKAKIICGLDRSQANGIVADILEKMTDSLISRVRSTFEYLSTHYPEYSQVDEILLYGAGAGIKHLDTLVAKKLNIAARVASPLANFSEEEGRIIGALDKKSGIAGLNSLSGYASAIGLSLRDIFLSQKTTKL